MAFRDVIRFLSQEEWAFCTYRDLHWSRGKLCFLDLQLPHLEGVWLGHRLRRIRPRMSAYMTELQFGEAK